MVRWSSLCLVFSGLGGVLGVSSLAAAQVVDDGSRSAARILGTTGVQAYQAGDYATANTKLEKAYQILKAPSLGLWSARALVKLNQLVKAGERYREVTRLPISSGDTAVQTGAQQDAQTELDALVPQIPSIVIHLEGAEPAQVTLTVDDQPTSTALIGESRPVDPGRHHVVARRGVDSAVSDVSVAPTAKVQVVLRFNVTNPVPSAATAALAPPNQESAADGKAPQGGRGAATLGWVGVGVGAAGLVFGGITGALALGKRSNINSSPDCWNMHCLASQQGTVDSLNSLRTLSSIGFIAGGVLSATGVVLILSAQKHETAAASLLLTPNAAVLRGRF